jgi:single-stranded DNA-binding protein
VVVPDRENACVICIGIFGKQAEPAARHLAHGNGVSLQGHLHQREIVTQDGQKVRSLEVVCERIEFLTEPAGHVGDRPRLQLPDAYPPSHFSEADPPRTTETNKSAEARAPTLFVLSSDYRR